MQEKYKRKYTQRWANAQDFEKRLNDALIKYQKRTNCKKKT